MSTNISLIPSKKLDNEKSSLALIIVLLISETKPSILKIKSKNKNKQESL